MLIHVYTAVICLVLEYVAPVWHHLINCTQAQQLESIQKRAILIIYNITRGMSYPNVLFVTWIIRDYNGITNQDLFFRTFANQPPVFTISFHLREIPLWSLDWDLPLPFLNPVYEPKSTVHLLTLAFTCISFAIRPSGRKSAIKLIDWLIVGHCHLKDMAHDVCRQH